MKFTKIFIILTICMNSCSSQSDFDLSEIKMPYNANNISKDYKYKKDNLASEDLKRYTSEDERLFVFGDLHFEKEFSDKYYSPTTLEFLIDETKNNFHFINLETFVKEDSETLYNLAIKKFGKPNYYNKDEKFFNALWEKGNTIFLLQQNYTTNIGDLPTISSSLKILDKSDTRLWTCK